MTKGMFVFSIRKLVVILVTVLITFFGAGSQSRAQESISQEEPTPSSVDEIRTASERAFEQKPVRVGLFPRVKEQLKDAPPFFRDTKLDLNLRTYYFYRDKYDDTVSEAWSLGGAVSFRSGWFLNRFGLGGVLYTSQRLYGSEDRDGTQLLEPGQNSYTVVGQIYGRVKLIEDHFLNLYRYEYDTPYLNKDDGRMTPKTFEGYTLRGGFGGKAGALGLWYGGGYITKIKERNSDRFVWMSQDAGADVKRGVAVVGSLLSYGRFSIGAMNYYSNDIINIGYAEAKYTFPVTGGFGMLLAMQFTDQRSVGDDLLTGSSFAMNQVGVKSEMSYGGGILTFAYTRNSRGADLQSPWSSYPGYTGVQVTDFNRAGENAFIAKVSYDFKRLGLEGATAYGLFVHGWRKVDPSTKDPVPDENEFNLDVQWRPKWDSLKGLWLRTRYGVVHQYEGPSKYTHDFRVIINYDFPLL